MTRKDYRLIAAIISRLSFKPENVRHIAECFARELQPTNVAFDVERFIRAATTEKADA